jgi:serine/threonine protein kinase
MSPTKSAIVTLGKYQIRGALGRGAMGTVFDGWDPVIGRRVAIKTVRLLDNDDPETQEGLARFKNEAQAAGRLSHPNVVAVYDYGESDETAFIVMEFIDGRSLKERLDAKERFAASETVVIMEQVLAALQFSHDRGVIHRDIKPGNVMMTRDGQVKLADFGIARIENSVMTQAGTMLGTPAYMSPEQLMAQAVDARSDIYSSGVLLYQLLTGERPFEGGLTAIIHKALNTSPPRPSDISVTAPASLDDVVARAMARRPADRYQDAATFARALRQGFEAAGDGLPSLAPMSEDEATMVVQPPRAVVEPPAVTRSVMPPPPESSGGFRPALLAGAAAMLLAAIGGGAWFVLRPATPEPGIAGVALPSAPAAVVPPGSQPAVPPTAPAIARPTSAPVPSTPSSWAPSALPPQSPTVVTPPTALVPGPPANIQAPNVVAEPHSPGSSSDQTAAPVSAVSIRNALIPLTLSSSCALPRFTVPDVSSVSVSGTVGAGPPQAALHEAVRQALQKFAPAAAVTWDERSIDGPYCGVLDVIRPIAQPDSPFLGLALKDDATRLKAHDLVLPVLKLPEFPSYLLVDYFSHDGSVAHLFPTRGASTTPSGSNATVRLGTSVKDRVEVGPPYGTDVIVATASSVPLFPPGTVRGDETIQTYIPALKAAIEAAQRSNARLTGRVLVVTTVER